ncbi:MAG: helix-turn-helix transcriptional regulator [Geminicoccaceae bacterium]
MARDMLGLVELCYAAAADGAAWSDCLAAITNGFGARTATIGTAPMAGHPMAWAVMHGLNQEAWEEIVKWAPQDPRAQVMGPLPRGEVVAFGDGPETEAFRRSTYYIECQSKHDLLWALIGRLSEGRDVEGVICLHRAEREVPFDSVDMHDLAVLTRHVGRARRMQLDLDAARQGSAVQRDLLDRLPVGLVVLGAQGSVLETNRAGHDLLAKKDGLALQRHRLVCTDSAVAETLAAMVDAAARGRLDGVGGVLTIPRPSGKPDYLVSVARCEAGMHALLGARAAVVVTIVDPARPPGVSGETLRRLWNLTATEAQIALALAGGATLEEVAVRSGITRETARVHLKRVLAKTGTHRQSELVRLILIGPAQLPS